MLAFYNAVIYEPLLNLLVWGYNSLPGHDVGMVIIVITLLVRLLLAPSMYKQLKSQRVMGLLQPELDKVKEKHKDDKEAQAKATMELYKTAGVNPFGSCLPLLIQLPILIALYQVFQRALNGNLNGLYHFVHNPLRIDPHFLGTINLAEANPVMAILAGVLQFWQTRMLQSFSLVQAKSQDSSMKAIQFQTTYLLPLVSVFVAWNLPSGLPLYWIVTTLFTVLQQYYMMRRTHPAPQESSK